MRTIVAGEKDLLKSVECGEWKSATQRWRFASSAAQALQQTTGTTVSPSRISSGAVTSASHEEPTHDGTSGRWGQPF